MTIFKIFIATLPHFHIKLCVNCTLSLKTPRKNFAKKWRFFRGYWGRYNYILCIYYIFFSEIYLQHFFLCGSVELCKLNKTCQFLRFKNTNHMKYESAFNVIDGIRNLIGVNCLPNISLLLSSHSPFNHAQDSPRLYTLHSTLSTLRLFGGQ